ncbi:MAG: hypothetical protein DHS20C16_10270 [Phycisphaerae bacterium]|nr:MAG: hypothetical protein DHS20C16_10270 [Phycisphaerae bacterium]
MMAVLLLLPISARAEDPKEAEQEFKGLWNVDSMMEQAVENISRRYNLNDDQKSKTKKMLVDEVTKFLDTHDNIWPLVRDLGRYQIKGEAPEGEIARRIGANALPLMEDIRETILSCNEDWDSILNEEQRRLHEWDLNDMKLTFEKMDENFTAMSQGKARNPGIFPGPNEHEVKAPPVRKKPSKDFKPKLVRDARDYRPQEDKWELYVQDFIKKYELTEGQSEAAHSILRECKTRAAAYRLSKERDFADAKKRLTDVRKSKQPAAITKTKEKVWTTVLQKLRKPVDDLFEELKDRLAKIPSAAQKKRAGDVPDSSPPKRAKTASKDAAPGKQLPDPESKTSS